MGVMDLLTKLRNPAKQRIGVYNGVAIRKRPLWAGKDHYPHDKENLTDAVVEEVDTSDRVVIVGGGKGTVPTHVARTGADTVVYEAAQEQVATLEETARLNDVRMHIHHAIVGTAYDIYGTAGDATHVSPSVLDGDVLILDCEGAETDILPQPDFDSVVVETHPQFGAKTDDVIDLMDGSVRVYAPDPIDGDVIVR